MKEKADKTNIKEEARALRKKTKRVEESRALIKAKSRVKGKAIKAYQDRQTELEKNRDDWKAKCKEQEKQRIDAEDKYKQFAAQLKRIVSTLNGEIVAEMLTEIASSVGKIISVCSDRGSEMLRGIKLFQVVSPETRQIGDTAHRVSNLLEATLDKDPKWKEFREKLTQSRRKMQNSAIPGALAPSPRIKARYMNVDSMIFWAADMLVLLDHGISNPGLDIEELRKYLGWILSYHDEIDYWNRLISIGVAARHVVRVEGIHTNIADSFEEAISSIRMGVRELQFADQLTTFLLNQSKGVKFGECFIGSSEILESLFGKIKYMEREQRAYGFTSLVLAAMAAVGPLDEKTVAEAMEHVKRSDIDEWAAKEIGRSVQSQRRQIKKIVAGLVAKQSRKIKMGQEVSGILERAVA